MSINIPKKRVESLEGSLDSKQNKLVAGQGISIDDTDPKNPIISSLSGGEGTNNYNELENQPRLNSVVLEGNKTAKDLSIFDKTTLIAGNNITIDEVLPEGGIDEYTLACWHFDDSLGDVVKGLKLGAIGNLDSTYYKFGGSSCSFTSRYVSSDISELGLNPLESSITADFWVKAVGSNSSPRVGFGDYSSGLLQLSISQTRVSLSGDGWYDTSVNLDIVPGEDFNHYALQYNKDKNTISLFFNGKKVVEQNVAVSLSSTSFNSFITYSYYQARIDEFRISNIARYNEDFTPPTQPYSKAESTGKFSINAKSEPLIPATTDSLGGIKVGSGLSITEDGTLNNEGYSSNDFTTPLKVKLQGIEENANNFSTSFNPETNTLIFSKGVK